MMNFEKGANELCSGTAWAGIGLSADEFEDLTGYRLAPNVDHLLGEYRGISLRSQAGPLSMVSLAHVDYRQIEIIVPDETPEKGGLILALLNHLELDTSDLVGISGDVSIGCLNAHLVVQVLYVSDTRHAISSEKIVGHCTTSGKARRLARQFAEVEQNNPRVKYVVRRLD